MDGTSPDEALVGSYELQDILVKCHRDEMTGILMLTDDGEALFRLFLDHGRVVFAESNDRHFSLSTVLVGLGYLTKEQIDLARENFDSGSTLAHNLLSFGLVSKAELAKGAREQIRLMLRHLVSLPRATAVLEAVPLPDTIQLEVPFGVNYLGGVMQIDDRSWLAEQFRPDFTQVYHRTGDLLGVIEGDRQRAVVDRIDGKRRIKDIIHDSGAGEFAVLKLLFGLRQLGLIEEGRRRGTDVMDPRVRVRPRADVGDSRWKLNRVGGVVLGVLMVLATVWWITSDAEPDEPEAPGPVIDAKPVEYEPAREVGPHGLLRRLQYDRAAEAFRNQHLTQNGFTIALELLCERESVDQVIECMQAQWSDKLSLYPKRVDDRKCFWFCWGRFDDEESAVKALAELPPCFEALASPPVVISLDSALNP